MPAAMSEVCDDGSSSDDWTAVFKVDDTLEQKRRGLEQRWYLPQIEAAVDHWIEGGDVPAHLRRQIIDGMLLEAQPIIDITLARICRADLN